MDVAAWQKRHSLPRVMRMDTRRFGRMLEEWRELAVEYELQTDPLSTGDPMAALVRECWARYGSVLREISGGPQEPWGAVECGALSRALPRLPVRRLDERIGAHRGRLLGDISIHVEEFVAETNGYVPPGSDLPPGERLESRREGYRELYDRRLEHPASALYALPFALLDASMGGPRGDTARRAARRLAVVAGLPRARLHGPADPVAGVPAHEDWRALSIEPANRLLAGAIGQAFISCTQNAVGAILRRNLPADDAVLGVPLVTARHYAASVEVEYGADQFRGGPALLGGAAGCPPARSSLDTRMLSQRAGRGRVGLN